MNLDYSKLKPVVNDEFKWKTLDNHLEMWYNCKHKELEHLDGIELYRVQGEVRAIKTLREAKVRANVNKS